ncbi:MULTISPECIES: SDR family oxidoreductase [unclassified Frankia]|uniref:SDR family oxidoreductase n=1 Tax=unclassified Frankia TaxID=2632575 RepID=UPI001EF6C58A|nr:MULTISPECIES: SDR family oxidoreductase [unclassified Frankia]
MKLLVVGGSGYLGRAVAVAADRAGAQTLSLSRSGYHPAGPGAAGTGLVGDATRPGFGLSGAALEEVREEVTHVVLAFGSVRWDCPPSEALAVHDTGMRTVLASLRQLRALTRVVHVSSLLVLGRAEGLVGNRELFVGQRFRNWYEYGKYCAERRARDAGDLPVNIVRLGPVLGAPPAGLALDTSHGLLAALPYLLTGGPVHLDRRGHYPCYVSEVGSAAQVIMNALNAPSTGQTWSWYDPDLPTLAQVYTDLCAAWGRIPRLVDVPALRPVLRLASRRVGVIPELLDYSRPWFELAPDILSDLPGDRPVSGGDYVTTTGRHLRDRGRVMAGAMR